MRGNTTYRSRRPEVFLGKGVLKISNKFTGEHPCRTVILPKLFCDYSEITVWHRCSPLNLLDIFRTPFLRRAASILKHENVLSTACSK